MLKTFLDNLVWLGHSGFIFKINGRTVTIDPFETLGVSKSDFILITHPHWDHLSLTDIKKYIGPKTKIISDQDSASILKKNNIKNVIPMVVGQKLVFDNFRIVALEAYNSEKNLPHNKQNNWLGFKIYDDNVSLIHLGDTGLIPEMNHYKADILLVPVSGTYVMDSEDAIQAVKRINPKVAIPMHFDSKLTRHWKIFPGVGTIEDAERFCEGINEICTTFIMRKFEDGSTKHLKEYN